MANPLHDSSTSVDLAATAFCLRLTQACADKKRDIDTSNRLANDTWVAGRRIDNPDPFGLRRYQPSQTFRYRSPPPVQLLPPLPTMTFQVSSNKKSSFRTPAEQAAEVAASHPKSNACWSAHMSDKARHILPRVDGRWIFDGDDLETILGDHLPWFKALWASELRVNALLNAGREACWMEKKPGAKFTDQLHVELHNARIDQNDERAAACVDEYARLVKKEGGRRNAEFEGQLKDYLTEVLSRSLAKYSLPGNGN